MHIKYTTKTIFQNENFHYMKGKLMSKRLKQTRLGNFHHVIICQLFDLPQFKYPYSFRILKQKYWNKIIIL